MEKEIAQILLRERSIKFSDLIGESHLKIKSRFKTFPSVVQALDSVLYGLDKFESENFISINRIQGPRGKRTTFFEGLDVVTKDQGEEITANKLHWFVEKINDMYEWEIVAESGIIDYVKSGYSTKAEREKQYQVLLSLGVAAMTALLTGLATVLATNFLNC